MRKQNSVISIPVAAYDLGISGIGGREIRKGQVRAGEQGDANRPYEFIVRGACKIRGLILVTNNTREFCRVEGLVVEDRTREQTGISRW